MTLEIRQFPCLNDNYGYLVLDQDSRQIAAIDTPDADAILAVCAARGLTDAGLYTSRWA